MHKLKVDADDVEAIDVSAATVAEDDVVAGPSAAQTSECCESVGLQGETLMEGLLLSAKLESESSATFSSFHVHSK